jgi:hypothetical protein
MPDFTTQRQLLTVLLLAFTPHCVAAPPNAKSPDADTRQWYKGNIHTHSLWSDGNDFPEMIVDWYQKQGYDFLAISDHNTLSEGERWVTVDAVVKKAKGQDVMDKYLARFGEDWVEIREDEEGQQQVRLKTLESFRPLFEKPGGFLLIQSEEISDRFDGLPIHINATNLRNKIAPQHGDTLRDTIRNNLIAAHEHEAKIGKPVLTHLNHPNFHYAVTAEDLAHVIEEKFFEVYNGHPSVGHRGDSQHASIERLWDIANTLRLAELGGPALFGVATDDAHTYHGRGNVSPGRGWIMVHADALNPESLIQAMRRGDFYASSGVTLSKMNYDPDTRTLDLQIDAEPGATYTIDFIGTETDYDPASEPVPDDQGQPIRATRRYSPDVGKVFKTVQGTHARFKVPASALYIRAVITSDQPPTNPVFDGQMQQAWTQPVGWDIPAKK